MKLSMKLFLGVEAIVVQGDSQLIIGQVNGTCEANKEQMNKYLNRGRRLVKKFKKANLIQVPREENMEQMP